MRAMPSRPRYERLATERRHEQAAGGEHQDGLREVDDEERADLAAELQRERHPQARKPRRGAVAPLDDEQHRHRQHDEEHAEDQPGRHVLLHRRGPRAVRAAEDFNAWPGSEL